MNLNLNEYTNFVFTFIKNILEGKNIFTNTKFPKAITNCK